jgi:hypothetical protein
MPIEEEGDEVAVEETPAAWDGSVDTLLTQPWVPEDARPHLEKHLASHREATSRRDFLDQVFAADDRTAELTQQLDTTRAELTSLKEALGKTEQERDGYRERENEAAAGKEIERLKAAYPDIFTEKDEADDTTWHRAWEQFYKLLEAGYPEDKAVKMARAYLPEDAASVLALAATPAAPPPPAERTVVVPKSVAAASRSSSSPSVTVNAAEASEDLEARMTRLEREERQRLGQRA